MTPGPDGERVGRLGAEVRGLDENGGDRVVVRVGGLGRKSLDDIHALDDVAKDGVFAVEVGHGLDADVELAAAGAAGGVDGIREAGHGDGAGGVAQVDFGREGVAGAAGAEPGEIVVAGEGIAHLDDRVGDDAVNFEACVEFVIQEFLEVGHGLGGGGGVEGDDDAAEGFFVVDPEVEDGGILGAGGMEGEAEEDGKEEGGFFHGTRGRSRICTPVVAPSGERA